VKKIAKEYENHYSTLSRWPKLRNTIKKLKTDMHPLNMDIKQVGLFSILSMRRKLHLT